MFVVECLPFSKGLNKEQLSYFSSKYLEPGSLVKISVRGKVISALTLESRSIVEAKSEIKSADFQLKKVSSVIAKPFLQKEYLEAIKSTAEYFVSTPGGILSHLIPSVILENPIILSGLKEGRENSSANEKKEVVVLQVPEEEKYIHYRSLIREEFAKKKSVFICLPQNEDIKQAQRKLEKGIESFVYAFHKDMSKKDLKRRWKDVCTIDHPVLILGTAKWLFLPRSDIGTIIIDKENENGWKTLFRPFIDLRFFAEMLANKKNIRTVIGDSFLRVETLHRYKQGEVLEFENVKWRISKEVKANIIDLRESNKKEKEFKTLSPEILGLISETTSRGSNVFIFAARKGLSPLIICRDCGEGVKCFNCSSPMVLYKTRTGGAFKCHQCGETRDAAEVCQKCRSWKLVALGSGIDKISEEIKKNIPKVNLFEIHKDVTPTGSKALDVVENFYKNRGSVLLGTEMAFSYMHKKVAGSAIASFDSLFSIPDFRIREKIFKLILETKELAKENFLIQTRNPSDPIIKLASTGDLVEFYKSEIEDRRVLGYPPFGIFIKITARGTKNSVTRDVENLKNVLEEFNPIIFNSIHEKKGKQLAVNAVIKLPKEKWVNSKLSLILKSLPPNFEIKVDPDNLL